MERSEFIAEVVGFEHRLEAKMAEIFCPVHLSLGHEGVAADIHEVIRPEDWLFSTHRNHHHYLAKGGDAKKLWNEILGEPSGLNGGFAGSQSISDPVIRFHSSAIVSGLVGVATGVAYALKQDGTDAISVCCLGDAATEQGCFWEALNFCALHFLPIAFIVENNGMSVDSPIAERQSMPLIPRVAAFGIAPMDSVQLAIQGARMGIPSLHEAHVKLECEHLLMASMIK